MLCPIEPGALIQYYDVVWYNDDEVIVDLDTDLRQAGGRYDIDPSTFSLTINSVNVTDSSTNYRCVVSVKNPLTHTNVLLYTEFDDTVTLKVDGEYREDQRMDG